MQTFLHGPIRDHMWGRILEAARSEQRAADRENRVWKFFEPNPAPPRVMPPKSAQVPFSIWMQAVPTTIVVAAAAAYVDYILAEAGQIPLVLVSLLSMTSGVIGARGGVEWRFRTQRVRLKDQMYQAPQRRRTSGRPDGFARKVTHWFDHYFTRYVPCDTERAVWRARTAGIRRSLRDEIVQLYREQRIDADAIAWLIRHLVGRVKRNWETGALHAYRTELATPWSKKATAVLGAVTLACGGLVTLVGAVVASPLNSAYAMIFLLSGGWLAARAWLEIILDHRRGGADARESAQELQQRRRAFERWKRKLQGRPTDQQMSAWLECDQKLLLDEALRHHALPMSDMIAYTFLEGPAPSAKWARMRGGPWRYSRYRMLIFLLTTDGVRQLSVQLDTERGTFHDRQWTNYRYDALAAVHVDQADSQQRTFKLSLVNGKKSRSR